MTCGLVSASAGDLVMLNPPGVVAKVEQFLSADNQCYASVSLYDPTREQCTWRIPSIPRQALVPVSRIASALCWAPSNDSCVTVVVPSTLLG